MFEFMASHDLFVDTVEATLERAGEGGRREIISGVEAVLPTDSLPKGTNVFDFTVSRDFSGSPYRCARFECREKNLLEMARFAALYANTIVLPNPFDEPVHTPPLADSGSIPVLADTVRLLYRLRPLIDEGLVTFGPRVPHFCSDCLAKSDHPDARFARDLGLLFKTLLQQYGPQISCSLIEFGAERVIHARGPQRLLPHGEIIVGHLSAMYRETQQGGTARVTDLGPDAAMKVLPDVLRTIVDDIYVQNWLSGEFQCNFLTNSEVDIEIVDTIRSQESQRYNGTLADAFSHSIPYVDNAPLEQLIRLRAQEGEAFRIYRDALSRALSQAEGAGPVAVREVFRDIVRPEINRIDMLVKSSKGQFRSVLGAEVLIGLGAVAIGHFLRNDLAQLAAALGGPAIAKAAFNLVREPERIRKEPYYFLWRAQQIGMREW